MTKKYSIPQVLNHVRKNWVSSGGVEQTNSPTNEHFVVMNGGVVCALITIDLFVSTLPPQLQRVLLESVWSMAFPRKKEQAAINSRCVVYVGYIFE